MKKVFAFILAFALMISSAATLTGCGNSIADGENDLEIQIYDRGYGTAGVDAVAAKYREKHPEINIEITGVVDNTLATDIYAGPSSVTTDLYFFGGDNMFNLVNSGSVTIDGVAYDNYFEPLTEVFEYTPEGETKKIKEKMLPSFERFYNVKDGKRFTEDAYYCAPWMGGLCGLVYNSKMFRTHGWTVPVTTDELIALSDTIIATPAYSTNKNSNGQEIKVAPFSFCLEDSYWSYVYQQWWAQYDGVEKYDNYFKGQDMSGNYTPEITASTGRLEMLKLLDSLIGTYKKEGSATVKRDNVYCDPSLNTRSFMDTQGTFLSAEGARINTNGATTSAMMPSGDWLENEMSANFSSQIESGEIEFRIMRTPVISAIRNHPDCEGTIESDAELSALTKAIDAGSTALSGEGYDVSQKAYDKIREARTTVFANVKYSVYVPAFATAKQAAKEFLKYLYSDEGIKIFSEATDGQDLPFEFDWDSIEGVTDFQKSKFDVISSAEHYAIESDKYAVVYRGGHRSFRVYTPIESKFNVNSPNDYIDPETIFIENYNEIQRLWPQILLDAGVN